MNRNDFVEHFTQNLYKYGYEAQEELYKKLPTRYDKIAEVIPLDKVEKELISNKKGHAFIRDNSIIGPDTLKKVPAGTVIPTNSPQEGFPVVGAKKKYALAESVDYELERDWGKAESFIEELVKSEQGWGSAIAQAKEDIIIEAFKYAGFTAGAEVFDNDIAGLTSHTYGDLLYDSIPWAALTGAPRTAKNGTTYYNSFTTSGTTVTIANLKTGHNLKIATNAKMENGKPYDNGQNKILVCHNTQELDWNEILDSKQDPDSANNRSNGLYKQYKVLGLPGLSTSSFFAVGSSGKFSGIKMYIGNPIYNLWYVGNPPSYEATVILNYIFYIKNFRPWVFANAATS